MFSLAMVIAAMTVVDAVPINNQGQADADFDLEPRAATSIISSDGCCASAGCKRARSVFEPYCATGCYGDKPYLHLPCSTGSGASPKAATKAGTAAGTSGDAGKGDGAKIAEDVTKNVDTASISKAITKAMNK